MKKKELGKTPTSAKVGNILVLISSILFIPGGFIYLLFFIVLPALGGTPITSQLMVDQGIIAPEELNNWALGVEMFIWLVIGFIAIIQIVATICGISWFTRKGKMQGAIAVVCLIILVMVIVNIALLVDAFSDENPSIDYILMYVLFEVIGIMYFLGWTLARNDFEY